MEEIHRQAEKAARDELGGGPYGAPHDQGARHPVDHVVALALAGADHLTAQASGGEADADPLTSREREVAALVAEGLSNREIAARPTAVTSRAPSSARPTRLPAPRFIAGRRAGAPT